MYKMCLSGVIFFSWFGGMGSKPKQNLTNLTIVIIMHFVEVMFPFVSHRKTAFFDSTVS